jgi:hypothetical protein
MVVDLGQSQQIPMLTVPDVAQAISVVSARSIAAQIYTGMVDKAHSDDDAVAMARRCCRYAFILIEEYDSYAREYEKFQQQKAAETPKIISPV